MLRSFSKIKNNFSQVDPINDFNFLTKVEKLRILSQVLIFKKQIFFLLSFLVFKGSIERIKWLWKETKWEVLNFKIGFNNNMDILKKVFERIELLDLKLNYYVQLILIFVIIGVWTIKKYRMCQRLY